MAPRAGGIKSWVLAMLAAKRRLRVAPVPPHAADLTPPARGAPVMPGRDEGTAAAVEPRNNHKQAPRLAVNTICRLQSLAQWWVRLNHAPHTEIRTLPCGRRQGSGHHPSAVVPRTALGCALPW